MIKARCHPALFDLLPKPEATRLPGWLRDMPSEVAAPTLAGEAVRTLKHCPPIVDAMSTGLTLPLACDLEIRGGEISWDWAPPVLEDTRITRAPIGLHVPEQAQGAPFASPQDVVIKFINFWTLSAPEGFSLLFTHPLNREDLPFRTLSGLVDCDLFGDGYVHFPALWAQPDFEGTLPKGTPIAQVFAIPRAGQNLDIGVMDAAEIARNREVQKDLGESRGVYRKRFRH